MSVRLDGTSFQGSAEYARKELERQKLPIQFLQECILGNVQTAKALIKMMDIHQVTALGFAPVEAVPSVISKRIFKEMMEEERANRGIR